MVNTNLMNICNWTYNKYNIETNFNLDSLWEFNDETHWKASKLNNLDQILSLLHYPNKLTHQFDFGASDPNFQFLNTIDEYGYHILATLADN